MARLKSCPDCGAEVSKKAMACPKCGRVLRKKVGCLGKVFRLVLLLFVVIFVAALFAPKRPGGGQPGGVATDGTVFKLGLHILPSAAEFFDEHTAEFGFPRKVNPPVRWRHGLHQDVFTDSDRRFDVYDQDGKVTTLWEMDPVKGRRVVWGESYSEESGTDAPDAPAKGRKGGK